jgi:hypothetical protein
MTASFSTPWQHLRRRRRSLLDPSSDARGDGLRANLLTDVRFWPRLSPYVRRSNQARWLMVPMGLINCCSLLAKARTPNWTQYSASVGSALRNGSATCSDISEARPAY